MRNLANELALGLMALALGFLAPARLSFAVEPSSGLQLEVFLNGAPINLIASFTRLADGRMAIRPKELADIGVKAPPPAADGLVGLDNIAGLAYRYDEPGQKIFLTLGDALRIAKVYNLRGGLDRPVPVQTDFGAVLNYQLFASAAKSPAESSVGFSGANATLDARAFGRWGTLSQSAILGNTTTPQNDALRLDTTWTYSDPSTLQTYRAGDVISGGLAWTRPIRLGGLQWQRDFALRPDLVTMPLPTASGSAAVPSSLEVYVNSLKAYSQDIPAGPYELTNIPTLSAAGTAQIVVRDASGHETQTSVPFFTSPDLLRTGLFDFSLEAGAPRLNYVVESNDYSATAVGSGTLRAGLTDWLTVQAHAEGDSSLLNGGLGTVVGIGTWGVLSLAGAGSRFGDSFGAQGYASFDTRIMQVYLHGSFQQTFGAYNDLAAVTANAPQNFAFAASAPSLGLFAASSIASAQPLKSLDTISAGFPLPWDRSSMSVGYVRTVQASGSPSNLATFSYGRALFEKAALNLTAFVDLSNRKDAGVFLGLSMALDSAPSSPRPSSLSTSLSGSSSGASVAVQATKTLVPEPDNYGYQVRDAEGNPSNHYVAGSYRSSVGQVEATAEQTGPDTMGTLQLQGAIATMGGGVFLSNRIDDSFAVVDGGAPGVKVLDENRPAGVTNSQGLALIPTLRSYQTNKIAIDPLDLPLNADAPATQEVVAPANRGGVLVRFGVKTDVKAAVVVLRGKDGSFLAAGAAGRLEGSSQAFVVGFDGRAYVEGLGPTNTVVVGDGADACRASFSFAPQQDRQVVIGPLTCQ